VTLDTTVEVGEVIDGRYRVTAALGRGGMGSVYRAEHVTIKRQVALKLLNKELRQFKEINERFEREAFATGRLNHPNCVTISDSGTLEDGTTYLAMEYLDGRSLADELAENDHLPIDVSLRIARHVLAGLAHAHGAGVVHRDLKPENIFLVKQDGDPNFAKILDFGIAKLIGEAMDDAGGKNLTQAGIAVGSPTYMSPEQATGEAIDGRTDLYSLSILLHEMITGRPPFYGPDKVAVLRMHLLREVPPLSEAAPEIPVPPVVEQLIRQGLEKRPADRFQTAEMFMEVVDHVLAGGADMGANAGQPTDAVLTDPQVPAQLRPQAPMGTPAPNAYTPVPRMDTPPPRMDTPPPRMDTPPPSLATQPNMEATRVGPRAARHGITRLVSSAVVLAILATVATVIVLRSGSSEQPTLVDGEDFEILEPDEEEDEKMFAEIEEDTSSIDAKLDKLERKLSNRAASRGLTRRLQAMRKANLSNPKMHRLLGLAFMSKRWWRDGFDAYRKAISLDPELAKDPVIIKDAIRALTSRKRPGLARSFLVDEIGEPAIPYLEETIAGSKHKGQRAGASKALNAIRAAN
jgi:serine/threonine protein kinase